MRKRLIAVMLVALLCMGMSMTAYAVPQITPEEQPPAEATEEEAQAFKAEQLKKYYDMPVATNEIKGWPQGPGTHGEAAIIMEAGTGEILYGKNIDDQHYPASITKVLTALVALENGKLDDKVTFTHDCVAFLQPGDSSIGMKENDEITLEQALYATLLASANEAAYAVAENVGKNAGHDYQWFIDQMNVRCKELGGTNSNFVNANGLHDENHYTSARDMALIGRELFKHPEFFKIVQTLQYEIPASGTCQQHVFQQKHKMLQTGSDKYYEYAVGGKTGYTSDALATLITMADNGSMKLICVVLRTHGGKNYPDTTSLFNYAFDNFERIEVKGQETSEDVGEILEDKSGEHCGYVVVPKGVKFSDLKMKMAVDKKNPEEAVLTYTYEDNLVGSAKAKLSEKYMKEHKSEIKKMEKKDKKNSDKSQKMSLGKLLIVVGLAVVLLFLLLLFIAKIRQYRRRLARRRRRLKRRQSQQRRKK